MTSQVNADQIYDSKPRWREMFMILVGLSQAQYRESEHRTQLFMFLLQSCSYRHYVFGLNCLFSVKKQKTKQKKTRESRNSSRTSTKQHYYANYYLSIEIKSRHFYSFLIFLPFKLKALNFNCQKENISMDMREIVQVILCNGK